MRSDTLRPALAAGLCVAALGFGAATLSNAVVVSSKPNVATGTPIDVPWPTSATYVGVALAAVLLLVGIYALDGRGIRNKSELVKAAPILAGIIILIVVVNHLFFTAIEPSAGFDMSGANLTQGGGGGGGNNSSGGGPVKPAGDGSFFGSLALIAVLLTGVIAVFGAEYLPGRGSDDGSSREEVATDDEDAADEIGEAAGRAADRIEAADERSENEVYRAWREMADSVDVDDPRTSTPAEFAAAATDAGLDPERVGELTGLFEAVRYGDREVTDERERRAADALRAIEREQGGDDA